MYNSFDLWPSHTSTILLRCTLSLRSSLQVLELHTHSTLFICLWPISRIVVPFPFKPLLPTFSSITQVQLPFRITFCNMYMICVYPTLRGSFELMVPIKLLVELSIIAFVMGNVTVPLDMCFAQLFYGQSTFTLHDHGQLLEPSPTHQETGIELV